MFKTVSTASVKTRQGEARVVYRRVSGTCTFVPSLMSWWCTIMLQPRSASCRMMAFDCCWLVTEAFGGGIRGWRGFSFVQEYSLSFCLPMMCWPGCPSCHLCRRGRQRAYRTAPCFPDVLRVRWGSNKGHMPAAEDYLDVLRRTYCLVCNGKCYPHSIRKF